jgi:glutaminase
MLPSGDTNHVSTGQLPASDRVRALITEAYDRFGSITDGQNADYIEALASVPPELFAIAVAGTTGEIFAVGDAEVEFSIQSVSKPFVFALIRDALGGDEARARLGVNATGLPFDSVMAIELHEARTINPLVNAGAIATTSLAPGASADAKWRFILDGLSRFAGRELVVDARIYASEAASNQRNQGIARLLESYQRIDFDPLEATDIYTRQCSLKVNARDLAVMGATLANGGVNPVTNDVVVDATTCQHALAVMATAGLYDSSGDWLYDIGLPGKSGVGGGIVTVAPGKGGLGTFAPPLDEVGNSVRGQLATRFLSERLGLNLFTSRPRETRSAARKRVQASNSPATQKGRPLMPDDSESKTKTMLGDAADWASDQLKHVSDRLSRRADESDDVVHPDVAHLPPAPVTGDQGARAAGKVKDDIT